MFNECRHIMPSGAKCKSPALRGQSFCYYHARLHNIALTKGPAQESLRLPSLEDPQGIQTALMQVLGALGSPSLDNKRAGLYLYGMQIAAQLANRASVPEPRDVVRSFSGEAGSDDVLAPEAVRCEPGTECDSCATRDDCLLPDRVAYLEARQIRALALRNLQKQQREIERLKGFFSQAEAWANEPEWQDPCLKEDSED